MSGHVETKLVAHKTRVSFFGSFISDYFLKEILNASENSTRLVSNIMSNLLKSKVLVGLMVVVAFAFVVGVFAPTASAEVACSITSVLRQGSAGADVMCLQTKLGISADGKFGPLTNAAVKSFQASNGLVVDGVVGPNTIAQLGVSVMVDNFPAGCTSASGFSISTGLPCTAAAAATFAPAGCTSASGFSPVTGEACYVVTSATLPAGCSSTAGYSPTTGVKCDSSADTSTPVVSGPLAGTAGTIADVNRLSQYSNEEVGESQKDVKVLGFEVKASKEGDIGLKSAKVSFAIANADGSRKLHDYVDTVSIWHGSSKIATVDAIDFNKDSTGNYSKIVAFDSDVIVKSDTTEKFYVSVSSLNNLDSGDIDSEAMTIGLDNIRYVDGSGVVTTEATQGDLPISGVVVSFVSFSTASNIELKIQDNSTPVSQVVKVSATADTNDVVLTKGKLKLDGTSSVWLDELPVTLTTTGDSIDAVASSVTLTLGGVKYTETLGTNCVSTCASNTTSVVTFNNLNYTIDAGDTVNFTISADINDIENTGVTATDFDEGDTLLATINSTNRGNMVAEDDKGDQLTDATEMTGSLTGNAQAFYSSGIQVSLVSTSATRNVSSDPATVTDTGTYVIKFNVTALGADEYIDKSTEDDNGTDAAGQGVAYEVLKAGVDSAAGANSYATASGILTASGSTTNDTTNVYKVIEGQTREFTLTVTFGMNALAGAGQDNYQVAINSINWGTATNDTNANYYSFSMSDYLTDPVYLNDY